MGRWKEGESGPCVGKVGVRRMFFEENKKDKRERASGVGAFWFGLFLNLCVMFVCGYVCIYLCVCVRVCVHQNI